MNALLLKKREYEKSEARPRRAARAKPVTELKAWTNPPLYLSNQPVLRLGAGDEVHAAAKMRPGAKVTRPGDSSEREADRAAEQVMSAPGDSAPSAAPRRDPEGAHAPGRPLDSSTRAFMESRFGQDFSTVRVAADREADLLSRGLGARAFTHGERVTFASGEFAPHTPEGRRLIAHELAHVVQQRASGGGEIARQPSRGSLLDQALEVMMKLGEAKSAAERKPVVAEAMQLADTASAALTAAKAATPPNAAAADAARAALIALVRGLANNGEPDAAMQVALKSNDLEVKKALVNVVMGGASGGSGQQEVLTRLAPLVGEKIPPPVAGESQKQWLEKNTTKIGKVFKALEDMGMSGVNRESMAIEMSLELLKQYFVHSDANEPSDPEGKISHLSVDSDKIKADCDVYASYGARLLRAQGWTTAGYLVILPKEPKEDDPTEMRDAHAVALAKRQNARGDWEYLGVSNEDFRELYIWSSINQENPILIRMLTDLALEAYDKEKPLKKYEVYYEPAKAGGAYDPRLLDPANKGLTPIKIVR